MAKRTKKQTNAKNKTPSKVLADVVRRTIATYVDERGIDHIDSRNLPSKEVIFECLDKIFTILFPGFMGREPIRRSRLAYTIRTLFDEVFEHLSEQIQRSLCYECEQPDCPTDHCRVKAEQATVRLLEAIPRIRQELKGDVAAAYVGDPAARSFDEIVLSYPCIEAIATYRIAHELYKANVPLMPRIMSERAHSRTGIDIHPGATIGESFFIDHGTGVVIGETTRIGNNVRIYQGVTLGARSLPTDDHGQVRRSGRQRHPTIEDNVTIYPDATILGGQTRIGKNAVVGGNVWLVESVKPNTTVMAPVSATMLRTIKRRKPATSGAGGKDVAAGRSRTTKKKRR